MSRQLDGETTGALSEALSSHLIACPACRRETEQLECVQEFLQRPKRITPSPGFVARVKEEAVAQKVTAKSRAKFSLPFQLPTLDWWKPAIAGLACLILFILSFSLGSKIGDNLQVNPPANDHPLLHMMEETVPFSVFFDSPDGSAASAYFTLIQE